MEPLLRLLPGVAIPPPPPPVEAEVEEAMRISSILNVSNYFSFHSKVKVPPSDWFLLLIYNFKVKGKLIHFY